MSAIGVDIDDVLFPWYANAHAASVRAGIGVELPTSWHPYREYGVEAQVWYDALAVATLDGSLYAGDPYPDAVAAMQSIADAGHAIHLITARGFLTHGHLIRAATVTWLHEHEIPHDTLTFSRDKTVIPTDYFLDDNADNIAAVCAAGSRGFLLNQTWNAHATHADRVTHISEFAAAILEAKP